MENRTSGLQVSLLEKLPGYAFKHFRSRLAGRRANLLQTMLAITILLSTCPQAGADSLRDWQKERSVYEIIDQADDLIRANRHAQARDLLLKAAALDPTSYSAYIHNQLARCYLATKNTGQAINEGLASLKFDPNNDDAMYALFLAYKEQGHMDTALHYLNKSAQVSKDPGWKKQVSAMAVEYKTFAQLQDGLKLAKEGKVQTARQMLEKAAASDPSKFSGDVHSALAYVLRRAGQPEKSIDEGKKALSYDPDDSYTVYNIAIAYQDIGRFDDAVSWLTKYVGMADVSEKDRIEARQFIRNLNDDRSKVNASTSRQPDYFEWMKGDDGNVNRWPRTSLPIKLYIGSGKDVYGYRGQFPTYIKHAFDTWCQASGGKLSYVMTDKLEKADINVVWTPKPILLKEKGRERIKAGLATVHPDSNGGITNVRIQVSTVDGYKPQEVVEDGECASVCMHEVGHSLGLGHSPCPKDVMYFSSSSIQSGLPTQRDQATIAKIYSGYPVIASAPVKTPAPKVDYLPPPMFAPPKLPEKEDIEPPFFMPPPIEELPPPPMFTPPPLPTDTSAKTTPLKKEVTPAVPMFTPPALETGKQAGKKSGKKPDKEPDKKPVQKSEPDPNELFFAPPPW